MEYFLDSFASFKAFLKLKCKAVLVMSKEGSLSYDGEPFFIN